MAGGLAALLDDVAAIAKMASAASTKAVGVVVDDTAVAPQFVEGVTPARELPIIGKIALGSLANKAILLVLILVLSQFVPWLLTPLLMLGGTYLCFEGAEKVWEYATGHHESPEGIEDPTPDTPAIEDGPELEKKLVRGAVTTDFILSAEIMVISAGELTQATLVERGISLAIVGLVITALVYGVVALIVKMDDVGLHFAKGRGALAAFGRGLVQGMPKLLAVLSVVGMAAMLWVGGHIMVSGANTLGWHAPHDLIHHLVEPVEHVSGALAWLVDTLASAVAGLILGGVVFAIVHTLTHLRKH